MFALPLSESNTRKISCLESFSLGRPKVYSMMVHKYFIEGLPKEKKLEISSPNYLAPLGESWLDVKYRSARFISKLNQDKEGNYVVFTHGGFISSMLSSLGYSQIQPHGTMIFLTLTQNSFDNKTIFDDYQETIYKNHTKQRTILPSDFNKYIKNFDEYIKLHIKNIEFTFTMPTLTEEF